MPPPEQDILRRRPVWVALSELFLDTEFDEKDYAAIAKVIVASGYRVRDVNDILWEEVYPAVKFNLRHPVGEWVAFDVDWLQDRVILARSGRRGFGRVLRRFPYFGTAAIVNRSWTKLMRFLPDDFKNAVDAA